LIIKRRRQYVGICQVPGQAHTEVPYDKEIKEARHYGHTLKNGPLPKTFESDETRGWHHKIQYRKGN